MRAAICLLALTVTTVAAQPTDTAVDALIGPEAKVWQFALQCQHPAMKPNPDGRVGSCIAYVRRVVAAVAAAKNSPDCSKAAGTLAPIAIFEPMFLSAMLPDRKNRRAWDEAVEYARSALPACAT